MCSTVNVNIFPLYTRFTNIKSIVSSRIPLKIRLPCFSCCIILNSFIGSTLKNNTTIICSSICMITSGTKTKFNVLISNLNYRTLNKTCITLNCKITNNSKSTTNTNIILEVSILEGYICTN